MTDQGILQVVESSQLIKPKGEKSQNTPAGSQEAFEQLLKKSHEDPVSFWDEVAQELTWYEPWTKTLEGSLPDFKFFVNGISNPSINLLDRHVEKGRGNKVALIWESEDGSSKFYTYNMLLAEVNRFANALKSLGVKKGDGVAIYLPNLAEAFIAVLACFRIGAVYNSIFSGFSQNSLRDRLINFKPKVIITTDATPRRGKTLSN